MGDERSGERVEQDYERICTGAAEGKAKRDRRGTGAREDEELCERAEEKARGEEARTKSSRACARA